MSLLTIREKMESSGGQTTGFDYLRIGLALSVLIWHSIWYVGAADLSNYLWTGKFRFLGTAILPAFFALSGFLVSGSLLRTKLSQFIALRVIRLIPALAVEVVFCAVVLGMIFTKLHISDYVKAHEFRIYFLNIIGIVHFTLPGVFETNPGGPWVNPQLWTIPFEMECYLAIIVLSVLGFIKHRGLFTVLMIFTSIGLTAWCVCVDAIPINGQVPGRVMVMCFLAAVAIYLYRDVIPYSNVLGFASVAVLFVVTDVPNLSYLEAFPAAYAVVWLGLMRPPEIPFGDLSYGVYLFHLPIEQTIMRLMPGIHYWWMLSLISLLPVILFAWLSWTFIEYPILSRKKQVIATVDGVVRRISGRVSALDAG